MTAKQVHPETHEILVNARAAWLAGEITNEEYNQIVLSCFKAEAEHEILLDGIILESLPFASPDPRPVTEEEIRAGG